MKLLNTAPHDAVTRLLCGGFTLSDPLPRPLLTLLPRVLTMDPRSASISTWVEPVFALVRDESERTAPGAQAIFARLAEVFLSQALRAYLVGAGQAGLLSPAPERDARIDQAAALIRDQPTRQWTLQALAREVGMSRTLFATSFRAAACAPRATGGEPGGPTMRRAESCPRCRRRNGPGCCRRSTGSITSWSRNPRRPGPPTHGPSRR
jgi:Cupin